MAAAEWIFEHAFPAAMAVVALLAAVGVIGFVAWKRFPRRFVGVAVATLRAVFFILLFWTLLLPAKKTAITEVSKPRFAVLLDVSASMATRADPAARYASRREAAWAILKSDEMKDVASRCEVDVYPFANDLLSPSALDTIDAVASDGTSTRIRIALTRLFERLRGQQLAGVLLLSDGIDTGEKNDSWSDTPWPAPLYVAKLENVVVTEEKPDVRVDAIDTPRRAVVGWDTRMTVTVAGAGTRGEPFPVFVYKDGKQFEKIAVTLPAEGGSREVQIKLAHDAVAVENYRVFIPTQHGETQTNDNEMAVAVEALDAKNRVLFLEDAPRFEAKHFARALFANRDITPLAFFQMPSAANPEIKQWMAYGDRQGLSFDFTPEQLRLNKIIVLGDFAAEALAPEHVSALLDFVERGGSLILLGGTKAWGAAGIARTGLSKLLPFTRSPGAAIQGRFPVAWTAEGLAHPALTGDKESVPKELPPILSVFSGAKPTAGAFTLVEAKTPAGDQPVLITRMYGQGKVLAVLTDSLWRWQMRAGEEKPYPKFWRYMIKWMSPSAADDGKAFIELFTDAGTIAAGDPVVLQARLVEPEGKARKNRRVTCVVTTPSGRELPLTMQAKSIRISDGGEIPGYTTDFTPEEAGNYRAVATADVDGVAATSAPCIFAVRAFSRETELRSVNERLLQALARASGGRYGGEDEIRAALRDADAEEKRTRKLEYRSLWHSPLLIGALIALLTAEWMLRKRMNLG